MAGASRERVDAFLKDQQKPIAAQLHHLAVNQSHIASGLEFVTADKAELARVLMDGDDAGASNVGSVSRSTLVPNYRDLGPAFKSH
jgi:hypothetical protein